MTQGDGWREVAREVEGDPDLPADTVSISDWARRLPIVGQGVQYVNGRNPPLAALVTVIHDRRDGTVLDLCVFLQTGITFRLGVAQIGAGGGSDPGNWQWPV